MTENGLSFGVGAAVRRIESTQDRWDIREVHGDLLRSFCVCAAAAGQESGKSVLGFGLRMGGVLPQPLRPPGPYRGLLPVDYRKTVKNFQMAATFLGSALLTKLGQFWQERFGTFAGNQINQ